MERIVRDTRGELVQIANRASECFRRLVYFELSKGSGKDRGHHYHSIEEEQVYIISGKVQVLVKDLSNNEIALIDLKAGDKIRIAPGIAHAYRSSSGAQVLEYANRVFTNIDNENDRISFIDNCRIDRLYGGVCKATECYPS